MESCKAQGTTGVSSVRFCCFAWRQMLRDAWLSSAPGYYRGSVCAAYHERHSEMELQLLASSHLHSLPPAQEGPCRGSTQAHLRMIFKPRFSERRVKTLCRFLLEAHWNGVTNFKSELKYNLLNPPVAFSACRDGGVERPCYDLSAGLGAVLHVGVVMSVGHLL